MTEECSITEISLDRESIRASLRRKKLAAIAVEVASGVDLTPSFCTDDNAKKRYGSIKNPVYAYREDAMSSITKYRNSDEMNERAERLVLNKQRRIPSGHVKSEGSAIVNSANLFKILSDAEALESIEIINLGIKICMQHDNNLDDLSANEKMAVLGASVEYERLMVSMQPLVSYIIAKRYFGSCNMSQSDLIGYGMFGLHESLCRYRPEEGTKIRSYASQNIKSAIGDAVREHSRTIRVSTVLHKLHNTLLKVTNTLAHELGREPTVDEVSSETGIPSERIQIIREVGDNSRVTSFEAPTTEELKLSSMVRSPNAEEDFDEVLNGIFVTDILAIINSNRRIDNRQKMIFGLRNGIESFGEDFTVLKNDGSAIKYSEAFLAHRGVPTGQKVIGEFLGITESRVSQIETKTRKHIILLLKLKKVLD